MPVLDIMCLVLQMLYQIMRAAFTCSGSKCALSCPVWPVFDLFNNRVVGIN